MTSGLAATEAVVVPSPGAEGEGAGITRAVGLQGREKEKTKEDSTKFKRTNREKKRYMVFIWEENSVTGLS